MVVTLDEGFGLCLRGKENRGGGALILPSLADCSLGKALKVGVWMEAETEEGKGPRAGSDDSSDESMLCGTAWSQYGGKDKLY